MLPKEVFVLDVLAPIGFFDSGVGGLSVMQEVRRLLPSENMIYFADSKHCPYGGKAPALIRERAFIISDFLIAQGAKLLVIACNSASITALDDVRERAKVPVVGLEPAVKPAVAITQNGKVGVLATGVTLAGDRFHSLVERFGESVEVYTQACPGLVELIESGNLSGPETEALLRRYLEPLLARNVDTIVLGCTHYPFLRPLLHHMLGNEITIVDSGPGVARQVERLLQAGQMAAAKGSGYERFYTSGAREPVEKVIRLLWEDSRCTVEQVEI
jgi:glutamate racemase